MTAPARRLSSSQRTSTIPAPGRGSEAVRQRILRAALELFARDGFENTTVRTIARRCALTDAALYYYFCSKRDILATLWDIPQSRVLRDVDPATPLTLPHLMDLVDEMITASADMDAIVRLMIRQALSQDHAATAFRQRTMAGWRRDVRAHFLTALSPEDADLNTDLLTALVFGTTFPAQVQSGKEYPEIARSNEFRDELRAVLLTALPFCRDRREC